MKRTTIVFAATLAFGLIATAATTTIALAGPVANRLEMRFGGGGPGGGPFGPGGHFGPGGPGFEALLDNPMVRERIEGFVKFWNDEELVAELGLSPESIALLEQSYTDTKAALDANRDAAKAARTALRDEMEKDAPDAATVDSLIDEVSRTHTIVAKEMAGHRVVVKNLLTEEQEEILEAHRRSKGREHFQEGREKMEAFRELVKTLAADGDISDADWVQIEAALAEAPEPVRDHAIERLKRLEEKLESGEITPEDLDKIGPPPPPPGFGPGGPGFGPPRGGPRGPRPEATPAAGETPLPSLGSRLRTKS